MQVVDFPHAAPSVCFICESAHAGVPCVDTGRFFDPPGVTHLDGRKYICRDCVAEAAHDLGVFDEKKAELEKKIALQTAYVWELEAREALMDQVRDLAVLLAPLVVEAKPKPAPAKRPPKANA